MVARYDLDGKASGFQHAGDYSLNFQFTLGTPPREVKEITLRELLARHADILWEPGSHKYNVNSFILEIDEILFGIAFSTFTNEMIDRLIASLRQRGNSNATINRKMAALSKLLRKAFKMGEIHSLPEFKRQKERAGRIRFLEPEEEARLSAPYIEGAVSVYTVGASTAWTIPRC